MLKNELMASTPIIDLENEITRFLEDCNLAEATTVLNALTESGRGGQMKPEFRIGEMHYDSTALPTIKKLQKLRGKIPAYSAFGYGELFFSGETTINRLSAALAADIVMEQFLPKAEFTPEAIRKCLLDAKGFVLSEDFSNAFLGLERDNGKPVWQDFNPRIEIHTGQAQEYGMELQRAYRQFENKELLEIAEKDLV